jgi:twitching motility protein PilT
MQTFDQSIFSLFQQGSITYEEALRWASNVDEFKLKVQGISTTADMARDRDGHGHRIVPARRSSRPTTRRCSSPTPG